jgi:7 transmembrane sweet-taste receptor of 3 GCPR
MTTFLFFDGTAAEPMPLRDAFDENYLSRGIQVTGLILAGVAVIGAISSGCWGYIYRAHKLVRANQPEFLYLLCFGAALIATSSIFVAFDESDGFSEEQLSAMCSAFPWFFVIGYLLMYCALFSKLWRLSKLLQMRRKAVHVRHVLFPCVIIVTCSLIVLTVWQITDPFSWNREGIADSDPYETYGKCTSKKNGSLPFMIPIILLVGITVGTTAVYSWKLRNVQSELAESSWIFAGIFIHIQMWLVGVPVFFITRGISRDASYLMVVILTFTFGTILVGFIVGTKFLVVVREKYFGQQTRQTRISVMGGTTHISGLSLPHGGSSALAGATLPSTSGLSNASEDGTPTSGTSSSAEIEQLKLQNLELMTEAEALNVQIIQLENVSEQNQLLVNLVSELESKVGELELILEQNKIEKPESSPDFAKISI